MHPDDPTQRQQPPVPPQPGSYPPPPGGAQYPPPQPPPGQYPAQGYAPPMGYQHTTVASGGIPGWMHVLYAVGGFFTCGILWVVWPIHWWFAQSKSRSTTG